jgi:hypothetical protein
VKIEVLYFDGGPHHEPAVAMARRVLDARGIETRVIEVEVRTDEEAHNLRFLGSPRSA